MSGRRKFLRGLGAAAAVAPFARFSSPARAQVAVPKLLVFATGNSWLTGWNGSGSDQAGWGLSGVSETGSSLASVNLPSRLPNIFEPLEPFADRLNVIDNLRGLGTPPRDFPYERVAAHQQAAYLLTGMGVYEDEIPRAAGGDGEWYSKGQSIDQLFAERNGTDVLGFAFKPDAYQIGEGRISHFGPNRGYVPIQNPTDAFEAVYGADPSDPVAELRAERRRSTLALHDADAEAMLARLPERDRIRLNEHRLSVAAIQERLDGSGISCSGMMPDYGYNATRSENVPRLMNDFSDLMVGALACGRTNVGYLQIGTMGGGNVRPEWPELGIDEYPSDHSFNHSWEGNFERSDLAGYTQTQMWEAGIRLQQAYNTMFAGVLRRLEDTIDVDGRPMLDNTVCVHVKQMRTNHRSDRLMLVMAGGQGLGIRGGRFIRVEGPSGRPDNVGDARWLNDFWTGVAPHLGMNDLTTFGYPECNTTPLDLG